MNAKKEVSVTITLTLKEAWLLKAMVQNPLSDVECADVAKFRHDLRNILHEQEVNL